MQQFLKVPPLYKRSMGLGAEMQTRERRNRRLGPDRARSTASEATAIQSINRPGRPGYLAIKGLYQKGFSGNWGGVLYTRACQSASV